MKFIPLHSTNAAIIYKNGICSAASFVVITFLLLSLLLPILVVSLLTPYAGIWETHMLYEQPKVRYRFEFLFRAKTFSASNPNARTIICTNIPLLSLNLDAKSIDECTTFKYWSEDRDNNGVMDRLHFQQHLETTLAHNLSSIEWMLLLEAQITQKCVLSPPALVATNFDVPANSNWRGGGLILIDTEFDLKQYKDFDCAVFGSSAKTSYQPVYLNNKATHNIGTEEIATRYKRLTLIHELRKNPGYFETKLVEKDFERRPAIDGLYIQWDINISQIGVRYRLSIWERLAQFWLYFASFFGLSFCIVNRIKDYLFSKHIIGSWEIAPWKKLY